MFGVIKLGGKHYPVRSGQRLVVEKLAFQPEEMDATSQQPSASLDSSESQETPQVAQTFVIEGLAMDDTHLPRPALVTVYRERELKLKKVICFKKRRRHNSRRKNGHRQPCTVLNVLSVVIK